MAALNHKERRERLRAVYDILKQQGKVKFYRDFFAMIPNLKESDMTNFIKPDSNRDISLPVKYIPRLCVAWNINQQYLESGTGPMFKEDQTELMQRILTELQEIKELLKKK